MRGHHPTVRAQEEDTDVGEDTPDYDYIVQVRTGHLDVTRIKNPKVKYYRRRHQTAELISEEYILRKWYHTFGNSLFLTCNLFSIEKKRQYYPMNPLAKMR